MMKTKNNLMEGNAMENNFCAACGCFENRSVKIIVQGKTEYIKLCDPCQDKLEKLHCIQLKVKTI
jgi:hypothetical protein